MSSRFSPQMSDPRSPEAPLLGVTVQGDGGISFGVDSAAGRPTSSVIFEEHAGLVWRFLRGVGLSVEQAEDALQDVFLIAHQKFPTFENRSKLSTWVCGIARHVARNYRRRAARTARIEEFDEAGFARGSSPEEELCGSQTARLIHQFSQSLEGGMREVFVLCFFEELRPPEVAEILEVPLSTVYSRVRLLRAGLMDVLGTANEGKL